MGIVCSGPSKNFIIPTMSGENGAFTGTIEIYPIIYLRSEA